MTTYRLSFDNLMHVKCLATAIFIGNVGGWGVGRLVVTCLIVDCCLLSLHCKNLFKKKGGDGGGDFCFC